MNYLTSRRRAAFRTGVGAVVLAVSAGTALTVTTPATASPLDGDCSGMTPLAHTSATAPVLTDDAVTTTAGGIITIPVLANDTDADADQLALVKVGATSQGLACAESDGTVTYLTAPTTHGFTESFAYAATDGDFYRSAKVTVTVAPDVAVVAKVVRKLRGSHAAKLSFTNNNTRPVRLLFGDRKAKRPSVKRTIAPGATTRFTTRLAKPVYLASLRVAGLGGLPLTLGYIDAGTGRVRTQDASSAIGVGIRSALSVGRGADWWR